MKDKITGEEVIKAIEANFQKNIKPLWKEWDKQVYSVRPHSYPDKQEK